VASVFIFTLFRYEEPLAASAGGRYQLHVQPCEKCTEQMKKAPDSPPHEALILQIVRLRHRSMAVYRCEVCGCEFPTPDREPAEGAGTPIDFAGNGLRRSARR
jgi:hypothetical protein